MLASERNYATTLCYFPMMTTKVRFFFLFFFSFFFFLFLFFLATEAQWEQLSRLNHSPEWPPTTGEAKWIVKYGYKFLPLLISTPPSPPTRNIQELKTTKLLSFRLVTFCGYWHRHGDGRRETEYIFLPLQNVGLYLSLSWFSFGVTVHYKPMFRAQWP